MLFPQQGDSDAPGEELGLGAGIGIGIGIGVGIGIGIGIGVGVGVGSNAICVGEHPPSLLDCLARVDSLGPDDWTHVAVVVEDRAPRIHLDGERVRSGLTSNKAFVFASWRTLGTGLGLGSYAGGLDEFIVYDRALADDEIRAGFEAGIAGRCRPVCGIRSDDARQGATVAAHRVVPWAA